VQSYIFSSIKLHKKYYTCYIKAIFYSNIFFFNLRKKLTYILFTLKKSAVLFFLSLKKKKNVIFFQKGPVISPVLTSIQKNITFFEGGRRPKKKLGKKYLPISKNRQNIQISSLTFFLQPILSFNFSIVKFRKFID